MKPLLILIVVFPLSVGVTRFFVGMADYALAGRIAMSVMLVFTSMAHFRFVNGMVMMMPHGIPYKKQVVLISGALEVAGAVLLLIPATSHVAAFLLIIFFLMILPANIHAAMRHVNLQRADTSGNGSSYLWFRIPLQFFFIAWIYVFAICLQ